MDQNLDFQRICAFPSVKVCVYDIRGLVYSELACIRGLVDSEPVYTFIYSFLLVTYYTVIFHLRELPSELIP